MYMAPKEASRWTRTNIPRGAPYLSPKAKNLSLIRKEDPLTTRDGSRDGVITGEGTKRLLGPKSLLPMGCVQVNAIFLTQFHATHGKYTASLLYGSLI